MFREMRLKEQQLSKEETVDVLRSVTHGTLSINGQEDYPYSVPISFVYNNNKIFFHGATEGQKHDLLTENPHVSFSVVDLDDVQPKKFTTFYRSAILYGKARKLEAPEEIQKAMELTIDKYSPGLMEGGRKFIKTQEGKFSVFEIDITHMTGKRSG